MKVIVEISVQENPWPHGGVTATERDIRNGVIAAVQEVCVEREAFLKSINFVKRREPKS